MRTTRVPVWAALLGVALALAPALAYAGFVSREPLVIEPTAQRAGDVYQFRVEDPDRQDHPTSTLLEAYLGEQTVSDAWGREVTADVFQSEEYDGDEPIYGTRCSLVPGSVTGIRSDLLYGDWARSGITREVSRSVAPGIPVGQRAGETVTDHSLSTIFDVNMCGGSVLSARRVSEGETSPLSQLIGDEDSLEEDVVSQAAVRTTFAGRPALRVAYDVRDLMRAFGDPVPEDSTLAGELYFVFAQALPVAAEFGVMIHAEKDGESVDERARVTLEGYERGAGQPRRSQPAHVEPHVVKTVPLDPVRFDDAGLGLAFSYADAFAAAVADPKLGFGDRLAAHPGAFLEVASYDATMEHPFLNVEKDGGWYMQFRDGSTGFQVLSMRASSPIAQAQPVLATALTYSIGQELSHEEPRDKTFLPPAAIRTADMLPLLASEGVQTDRIASVTFGVWADRDGAAYAQAVVSDVPTDAEGTVEGTTVFFDPFEGALELVAASSTTGPASTSPLQLQARSIPPARADVSAFSALVGPVPGAGLAATGAAATGLALLVVAVKFGLLPFYSRLVRDRLLDNPVRAQLFTRIRAEPGIRRQELIDFVGVGEGATRRHLDALAKHGFVVEFHEGAHVGYYASGDVPPALARRMAVLRSESARRVYELYAAEPALSLRAAGERLGMSAPGVHRIKKKLETAGLLPAASPTSAEVAVAEA